MTSRDLANQIATDLFTDGSGKHAQRLVMEMPPTQPDIPGVAVTPKRFGGGYCVEAVISLIQKHLEQNMFWRLS